MPYNFNKKYNRLGFQKILEIQLLDKSIVPETRQSNKGKPTSQLNKTMRNKEIWEMNMGNCNINRQAYV